MAPEELRDLDLAGVHWELGEIPFVATQTVSKAQNTESNTSGTVPGSVGNRTPTSIVPPISPIASISLETARSMAARPIDIASLSRMITEFNHPLRGGVTNVVLPSAAINPNGVLIVTDIPSTDDDATGRILSGRAGDLFDKMLSAIGMSRDCVSIMPLMFWRTPGGRTPTGEEMELSRPFVNRALEIFAPRIILTLGTFSASEICGVTLPRGHGVPVKLSNGVTAIPIFHPSYLLLKPAAKRDAWTALQTLQGLCRDQ